MWKLDDDGNSAINEDGDILIIRTKIELYRIRKRDGREFREGAFRTYPKAAEHLAFIVECENEHSAKQKKMNTEEISHVET